MATPFISGTAGRVIFGTVTICGIKSWRLEQACADIAIPHFESPVDSYGRVWPEYLIGLCTATGTFEGEFGITADLTGTPTDGFPVGGGITVGFVGTLKLLFSKTTFWGFAVSVIITSLGAGTNVENQPATFTANFRVSGIVPLTAVVP